MKLIWQCMFSPRLYKIYKEGPTDGAKLYKLPPTEKISDNSIYDNPKLFHRIARHWFTIPAQMYHPQGLEKWGDKVISMASMIMNIGIYTSPFISMYIYKRGFFSVDELKTLTRYMSGVGCLLAISFFLRACGRATNPKYVAFLNSLNNATSDRKAYLNSVRKYDFEFHAWPVSYTVSSKASSSWYEKHPFSQCANVDLPSYQRVLIQVLAYVATHAFGLRLIYPGSLGLVQNLLWGPLFQGRTLLVEMFEGQRNKLVTADGNVVDTMFVDNRGHGTKGNVLVVCSEGNSGFYEIGIMTTPVKAGYSAIGWNHPGFGGSTGKPFPSQEMNAIDAVMQFAINELGFLPEDIVMFGWSIGGYVSAWAAVNYPVRGLILDATFDDLLPLAQNQMPRSWSLLVKEVVRSYVDLNIAELVTQFEGPVSLIRRTEDEIICLRPGCVSTNRGNYLAERIIETRHPEVTTGEVSTPLSKLVELLEGQRASLRRKAGLAERDKRILELIDMYLVDYKSSHCTPLPEQVFESNMASILRK